MAAPSNKVASPFNTFTEVQIVIVTFVLSTLVCKAVQKVVNKEVPRPPGPWGFPVLGHLPLLGKKPNLTFMKMRERFGDVFKIRMGRWDTVIVNGKKAIKEALVRGDDDFSGRPGFVSSTLISNGENFAFGKYDEVTRLHRRIATQLLFDLSSPRKSGIQGMVHEEVDFLVKEFSSHSGKGFDPRLSIQLSVLCVIYQICYGHNENVRESNNFFQLLENSEELTKFVITGRSEDVLPWLQYVMPWRVRKFAMAVQRSIRFRNKMVEEHRKTHSNDQVLDLVDGLLKVQKSETPLSANRLFSTIDSVFGAGFATVSSSIRWIILLMANNPRVQERVQKELDEVVGDGRRPTVQDRAKLVYTEAVLHEVNRFVTLGPTGIPHCTTRDTELCGYRIEKGTVVIANLYSMSHDKDVWGDPDVFRPERFLDETGQINKSLLEEFLPFSAGRRKCLGESLAKTQLFLYTSGLLQRCSFLKPPDVKKYNLEPNFGLTQTCKPYTVRVVTRD